MSSDGASVNEDLENQLRGPNFVQSLERGLAVILAFGADRTELTLTEVAKEAGLTRATTRRFLLTLVELGYVRIEGRVYSLRPSVMKLGYAYLSGLSLAEVAEPHVEQFVSEIHESSSICVLDGQDIVYVVRVPTTRIMTISISVGTRFPAYCTSMGRVLLANLPDHEISRYLAEAHFEPRTQHTVFRPRELRAVLAEVRESGYALTDQELEDGLRSAAVPIRDSSGRVIAAMNVSVNSNRVTIGEIRSEILPQLREAAIRIEDDLRNKGHLKLGVIGGKPVSRSNLQYGISS